MNRACQSRSAHNASRSNAPNSKVSRASYALPAPHANSNTCSIVPPARTPTKIREDPDPCRKSAVHQLLGVRRPGPVRRGPVRPAGHAAGAAGVRLLRQPPARSGRDLPSLRGRADRRPAPGPGRPHPIQPWPTYPPASGRRVLTVGWSGARPWPRSTSSITSCPTAAPLPAADSDVEPCERRAIGARRDARTFCTATRLAATS